MPNNDSDCEWLQYIPDYVKHPVISGIWAALMNTCAPVFYPANNDDSYAAFFSLYKVSIEWSDKAQTGPTLDLFAHQPKFWFNGVLFDELRNTLSVAK